MTVLVLHLSDIHIRTSSDLILERSSEIAACAYSALPSASHVFIVLSGDIAYSGEDAQYELAALFLEKIKEVLIKESKVPVTFVIAPGNHDCDFRKDTSARKILVKSLEESDTSDEIDPSIIQVCTTVQESFFAFRKKLEGDIDVVDDLLWRSLRFEVEGKSLGFECLNISWVSKLREDAGRLYFPFDKYSNKKNDDVDVRFIVLHHPLNWFHQNVYRPFRAFVRNLADVVISGHEHQGNVGLIYEAESNKSAFVEGCVLQSEKGQADSSFNVIVLDLAKSQFASTRYKWDRNRYFASELGSWSDYHELPTKKISAFTISDAFQNILDDPGAFFKHAGHSIMTLPDVYVYPDLKKAGGSSEEQRRYISSSSLLSPEATAGGVLIEGDEKAGRTSLLYQIFREYYHRGFTPLMIRGKDLRRVTDAEVESLIKRAVENQYGAAVIPQFEQLAASKKLLLLDDFDDGPMKTADARSALLHALRRRFGHLIVTVSETFELRDMLEKGASSESLRLQHYQLQPFNYSLRSQLIKQWYSLANDGTVDEGTFIARCDSAERLMNTVMKKSMIPSNPLYLLTLLQSLEVDRGGDFREGALGYYYQYLLTQAFQNCGVKSDKLTEYFQYCAYLAWEFHVRGRGEFSEGDLREFNTRFSDEWHRVDFTDRLRILVEARVLSRIGEDYEFRYPYVYYYLKGQYLSQNLSAINVREYVSHCCKHLYVRDHANTVLFLAHHTNDDYVVNTISDALHNLFGESTPVSFDLGDYDEVKKLIQNAPKLSYSGETPSEHRRRRNEHRDQLDDGSDDLSASEEESADLSLVARTTMLFKTTEILGQVLKNQYSKIQRRRKAELLEEIFNGPLRALRCFYDYFEKYPDALVAEVDAEIKRVGHVTEDERRKKIARKVVASLILLMTLGFVTRAAESAGSDDLLDDVGDIVNKNGTIAFSFIQACIYLDSPKPLPRKLLRKLYRDAQRDAMLSRLLQIMVLNRLYMFKTSEKDMQWLSSELDLDIGIAHSIAYQSKHQLLAK